MKRKIIAALLAALTVAAPAAVTLSIKPVCCRFIGWQGVEVTAPAPTNGQTYTLQYRTDTNTNWINVVPDRYYPGVEDGIWYYYWWHTTPTNTTPNTNRFWRIIEN